MIRRRKQSVIAKWFHKKTNMKFWKVRHIWDEAVFISIIASQYALTGYILDKCFDVGDAALLVVTALFLSKKLLKTNGA